MTVPLPTPSEMRALGERLGLSLAEDEIECYRRYFRETYFAYDRLDKLADNLPEVKYPRTPGYRPERAENPHGAWYVKTAIRGASKGKLAGKRIALKDTVALAGVPMMDGASVLEGYTPETDATIVTRILDAGGEIAGKAVCEYFSFSSGSITAVTGFVDNPVKPGWGTGGSSSGSAALVAAGEVDMAIGGDQAGSIRIPSAVCGVYGLKPTWGLVPYTGVISSEFNVDHVGPMSGTVADNALLLEVLAGPDGIDQRQATRSPRVEPYTKGLKEGAKGLRLAVIEEGFGWPMSMPEVDSTVRAAAARFAKLGATVDTVSLPAHRDGLAIWLSFAMEGYYNNLLVGNGFGTNHGGLYLTSLNDKLAGWRARANEFPPNLRLGMLMGQWVKDRTQGHYYAKAHNLARRLSDTYDELLSRYDLLVMPTAAQKAKPLPTPPLSREQIIDVAFENIENTCPFDLTHHPAMSIPCGMADGCPIGLMLVGRHYDEATIYRAAYAFEQSVDWRALGPTAASKRVTKAKSKKRK